MAETLTVTTGTKADQYRMLLPQIKSMIDSEPDCIASLANVAAAIYETFRHLWVGFYLVRPALRPAVAGAEELVLGPFQGPVACTRIRKGRGVCGTAWAEATTLVVPDVAQFPGHIACSSRSRSEIVVPIGGAGNRVWGVLDIDSEALGAFDEVDAHNLETVCALLSARQPAQS